MKIINKHTIVSVILVVLLVINIILLLINISRKNISNTELIQSYTIGYDDACKALNRNKNEN